MSLALEIGRAFVQQKAPYFSAVLYALIPRPVPDLGTAVVSSTLILSYDPQWLALLTREQTGGLLAHECLHVFNKHFERGKHYLDQHRFNRAADIAINDILEKMGWFLPPGGLFPRTFGFPPGLTAEEYYELLEGKEGAGGQGEEGGTKGRTCSGACGSVAGEAHPVEAEQEAALREEEPTALKSPLEVDTIQRQLAKDMQAHARAHRGSLPAQLVEWADNALAAPKVRWRQVLPRLIRKATGQIEAGGQDFSRKRLAKRSFVRQVIIPGMVAHVPVVAFIRDTSGSMGEAQLQDAQNEAIGVMKALAIEDVWFMDADAAAGEPRVVRAKDIPKLPITGRGGTDFGPALEAITKLRPKPDLVLYFTDGDGFAPEAPPRGVTIIWVIVRSYYNQKPCNWGHCVFVDD